MDTLSERQNFNENFGFIIVVEAEWIVRGANLKQNGRAMGESIAACARKFKPRYARSRN